MDGNPNPPCHQTPARGDWRTELLRLSYGMGVPIKPGGEDATRVSGSVAWPHVKGTPPGGFKHLLTHLTTVGVNPPTLGVDITLNTPTDGFKNLQKYLSGGWRVLLWRVATVSVYVTPAISSLVPKHTAMAPDAQPGLHLSICFDEVDAALINNDLTELLLAGGGRAQSYMHYRYSAVDTAPPLRVGTPGSKSYMPHSRHKALPRSFTPCPLRTITSRLYQRIFLPPLSHVLTVHRTRPRTQADDSGRQISITWSFDDSYRIFVAGSAHDVPSNPCDLAIHELPGSGFWGPIVT